MPYLTIDGPIQEPTAPRRVARIALLGLVLVCALIVAAGFILPG